MPPTVATQAPLALLIWPAIALAVVACALFLLGTLDRPAARRLAAPLALVSLLGVAVGVALYWPGENVMTDAAQSVRVYIFTRYIDILVTGIGALLVLLAWPTNRAATANPAMDVGHDTGEFFGLMLLSICGVLLVAAANDMMVLFLALELASIPTYIMVTISRPLAVAQEAGVKYFFLGAMSAALMLLGFSYLYGSTGTTNLWIIQEAWHMASTHNVPLLDTWEQLALILLILGFAFKIAAVPLHFYAPDVYQGAATPLTAFLSFVPKASGFVALIKILFLAGGGTWYVPEPIGRLLWVLAVLTMTIGNVLGLIQFNIKRVMAYSSIAHSGYMLSGLAVLASASSGRNLGSQTAALQGVLFYLAAYGLMNLAVFGVLLMLPARSSPFGPEDGERIPPATSAETYDDLAGTARRHPGLGLLMAVACFSLVGIPLTAGFFAKLYLIGPALQAHLTGLAVIIVINAAISAGYYLRIVGAMFLRPEPAPRAPAVPSAGFGAPPESAVGLAASVPAPRIHPVPVLVASILSVSSTLLLGVAWPTTNWLGVEANAATSIDARYLIPRRALPRAAVPAPSASPGAAVSAADPPLGEG